MPKSITQIIHIVQELKRKNTFNMPFKTEKKFFRRKLTKQMRISKYDIHVQEKTLLKCQRIKCFFLYSNIWKTSQYSIYWLTSGFNASFNPYWHWHIEFTYILVQNFLPNSLSLVVELDRKPEMLGHQFKSNNSLFSQFDVFFRSITIFLMPISATVSLFPSTLLNGGITPPQITSDPSISPPATFKSCPLSNGERSSYYKYASVTSVKQLK